MSLKGARTRADRNGAFESGRQAAEGIVRFAAADAVHPTGGDLAIAVLPHPRESFFLLP